MTHYLISLLNGIMLARGKENKPKAGVLWRSKNMVTAKKPRLRVVKRQLQDKHGSVLISKELCSLKAHVSRKVSIQQWDLEGTWQMSLPHKMTIYFPYK